MQVIATHQSPDIVHRVRALAMGNSKTLKFSLKKSDAEITVEDYYKAKGME